MVKEVQIPAKSNQGKPVVIRDYSDDTKPSTGHFNVSESQMKDAAKKMAETFNKNKGA